MNESQITPVVSGCLCINFRLYNSWRSSFDNNGTCVITKNLLIFSGEKKGLPEFIAHNFSVPSAKKCLSTIGLA
jgi:hypothetical protein